MAELPHVGVLGDTYHMAEAVKRRFPKPGDGQDYRPLEGAERGGVVRPDQH